jgi:hypothetical protein
VTTYTTSTRRITGASSLVLLAALCGACGSSAESKDPEESAAHLLEAVQPSPDIDPRRSLAITDQAILTRFSLQRVFEQLVSTSNVPGLTPRSLFQQWWDTQNPAPGNFVGPHCDDTNPGGVGSFNGYPYTCRPAPSEGSQANCDPFSDSSSPCAYVPIGLFMRFDLAPVSGANCGEYRIVFAKTRGRVSTTDRNLLIFEAVLPNPHWNMGIRGCEKFVRAWAELSNQSDLNARGAKLEDFYFKGYKEFEPVVSFSHYGNNADGWGQVRTNQFMQPNAPRIWSLREFKLTSSCSPSPCRATFVPATTKVNPFGPLFDPSSTVPSALAFQADFVNHVAGLAAATIADIGMSVPEGFDSAESQANGTSENDYLANFEPSAYASNFRSSIQSALTALGSTLSPENVVARAQALSCAGCHHISNGASLGGGLTWPASLGFTHISERDVDLEVMDGGTRYKISDALASSFLPARKALTENFLNDVPLPAKPANAPIGGRSTH